MNARSRSAPSCGRSRQPSVRHATWTSFSRVLDSAAHRRLLGELDEFCDTATIRKRSLDDVVTRETRRFRKAAKGAETDEEIHAARIRAKRTRYAAEAAGKRKLAERMKRLQDVAGERQDAVVAEERLRGYAEPERALVLGRLVERQAQRRRRARKAWAKLT